VAVEAPSVLVTNVFGTDAVHGPSVSVPSPPPWRALLFHPTSVQITVAHITTASWRFVLPWRVSSSGIWRRVVRRVSIDVSEEHIASIFRVEEIGWASHIPEDVTLHSHRCENLKSYMLPFLVVGNVSFFICPIPEFGLEIAPSLYIDLSTLILKFQYWIFSFLME
jgi:hypothetical protein